MTSGKRRVGGDADVEGQTVILDESEGETEGSCVKVEVKTEVKAKVKKGKGRRSWWCPLVGCQSGPTQKIEQHFLTVHGLPIKSTANYRLRKFKMAPTREAIQLRLPNPHARYSIGTGRTIALVAG